MGSFVAEPSSLADVFPAEWRAETSLRARLESALDLPATDPRIVRLSLAATSVTFKLSGPNPEAITVLLDRNPPIVAHGDEPAEVTIELPAEYAEPFCHGAVSLPPLLLHGKAGFRGPVRKYLMVDAVLRGLLAGDDGH